MSSGETIYMYRHELDVYLWQEKRNTTDSFIQRNICRRSRRIEDCKVPLIYRATTLPEEALPMYKETASVHEMSMDEPETSTLGSVEFNSN